MNLRLRPGIAPLLLVAFVLAASAAGCQEERERASVSGKVTFNGEPVKSGQIAFEPKGAGRLGIAQIVDGAYGMPASQGPSPGEYVVRITALRPTGETADAGRGAADQAPVDVVEQFIPARYNDRSELIIEIGPENEVAHDFTLTSASE